MAKFDVLSKVAALFKSDRGAKQQPRLTECGSTAVTFVEDDLSETSKNGYGFISSANNALNGTVADLSPATASMALYNSGFKSVCIDRIGFTVHAAGSNVIYNWTLMAALHKRAVFPNEPVEVLNHMKASTNGFGSHPVDVPRAAATTSVLAWSRSYMVANLPTSLTWFQVLSGGPLGDAKLFPGANDHKWQGVKHQEFNGEIIIRPDFMLIFAFVQPTAGNLDVGTVEVLWHEYSGMLNEVA